MATEAFISIDTGELITADQITGRFEEPNDETVQLVAEEFAIELRELLTAEQMEEVVEHDDPNTCKSHDFCDANMVMDAAVESVTGTPFDLETSAEESNNETALMNRAWDRAIENDFFINNS